MLEFKPGDVVRLKEIDSVLMLVKATPEKDMVVPRGHVLCCWFNNHGDPREAIYPIELVEKRP